MPENSGVASVCRSGIGASIVLLPVAGRCCYVRFRQGAAVPANRGMAVRHHGWCGESATRAQNCGRASGSGKFAEAAGCMPCAPGCLADSRLFAPCLTLSRCMKATRFDGTQDILRGVTTQRPAKSRPGFQTAAMRWMRPGLALDHRRYG